MSAKFLRGAGRTFFLARSLFRPLNQFFYANGGSLDIKHFGVWDGMGNSYQNRVSPARSSEQVA